MRCDLEHAVAHSVAYVTCLDRLLRPYGCAKPVAKQSTFCPLLLQRSEPCSRNRKGTFNVYQDRSLSPVRSLTVSGCLCEESCRSWLLPLRSHLTPSLFLCEGLSFFAISSVSLLATERK